GPSITFALENALAKAGDATERKKREEALANHLALPHPGGPDGRRMWGLALSFGIFKSARDPEAAMSLIAHLLSPEETLAVMRESHGQFTPVLDKARAATKEYFQKNENYRTFGRAAEWFVGTGWPGPVTAAAAEVQASNGAGRERHRAGADLLPRPLTAAVNDRDRDHRAHLAVDVRRLPGPRLLQQRADGPRAAQEPDGAHGDGRGRHVRRRRRQLVAGLPVLRRVVPRGDAEHPAGALRGGLDRRRQPVAPVLARHPARGEARRDRHRSALLPP